MMIVLSQFSAVVLRRAKLATMATSTRAQLFGKPARRANWLASQPAGQLRLVAELAPNVSGLATPSATIDLEPRGGRQKPKWTHSARCASCLLAWQRATLERAARFLASYASKQASKQRNSLVAQRARAIPRDERRADWPLGDKLAFRRLARRELARSLFKLVQNWTFGAIDRQTGQQLDCKSGGANFASRAFWRRPFRLPSERKLSGNFRAAPAKTDLIHPIRINCRRELACRSSSRLHFASQLYVRALLAPAESELLFVRFDSALACALPPRGKLAPTRPEEVKSLPAASWTAKLFPRAWLTCATLRPTLLLQSSPLTLRRSSSNFRIC